MSTGPDLIEAGFVTLANAVKTNKTDIATNVTDIAQNATDIAALGSGGPAINDAATSTTEVWSSDKTNTEIQAVVSTAGAAQTDATQAITDAAAAQAGIDGILAGANTQVDTFLEAFTEIQANDNELVALTTAVGNRVRFDAGQALTAPQQVQARGNIAAADEARWGNDIDSYDFSATVTAILNA